MVKFGICIGMETPKEQTTLLWLGKGVSSISNRARASACVLGEIPPYVTSVRRFSSRSVSPSDWMEPGGACQRHQFWFRPGGVWLRGSKQRGADRLD